MIIFAVCIIAGIIFGLMSGSNNTSATSIINTSATSIINQASSSVQLLNNTSDVPLHVFLQSKDMSQVWKKIGGNGTIASPVDWSQDGGKNSWDPMGAKIMSEAIIPLNGSITLKIPDDKLIFIIMALKMSNKGDYKPLKISDGQKRCRGTICKVLNQWPILIEGGKNSVADASGVDGINYKMKYEMTSDKGEVKVMQINKNPCKDLDKKYKVDVGCRNPAKVDCKKMQDTEWNAHDSCSCESGTQNCAYNDCSVKLFNVKNTNKYYHMNDGTKSGMGPVKSFIGNSKNIRDKSPLNNYCNIMQENSGDFTTYCYDYNDNSSSPYLLYPYKIRVTYSDL